MRVVDVPYGFLFFVCPKVCTSWCLAPRVTSFVFVSTNIVLSIERSQSENPEEKNNNNGKQVFSGLNANRRSLHCRARIRLNTLTRNTAKRQPSFLSFPHFPSRLAVCLCASMPEATWELRRRFQLGQRARSALVVLVAFVALATADAARKNRDSSSDGVWAAVRAGGGPYGALLPGARVRVGVAVVHFACVALLLVRASFVVGALATLLAHAAAAAALLPLLLSATTIGEPLAPAGLEARFLRVSPGIAAGAALLPVVLSTAIVAAAACALFWLRPTRAAGGAVRGRVKYNGASLLDQM